MPFLTVNRAKLYYEIKGKGKGKPILFLGGLLGNCSMFQKFIFKNFVPDYTCISLNYRGKEITELNGEFNFSDLVNDILELVNTLGLEKVNLVSDALANFITLAFCSKYPHLVDKMVIKQIVSYFDIRLVLRVKAWRDILEKTDISTFYDNLVPDVFSEEFLFSNKERLGEIKSMFLGVSVKENLIKLIDAITNKNETIDYKKKNNPVLLLCSKKDSFTPPEHSYYAVKLFRNAALYEIDAGHINNVEKPDEYSKAVRDFIS